MINIRSKILYRLCKKQWYRKLLGGKWYLHLFHGYRYSGMEVWHRHNKDTIVSTIIKSETYN